MMRGRFDAKVDKLQNTVEEFIRKDAISERHLKAHIDTSVKVVRTDLLAKLDKVLEAVG